ncbi:MAG: 50S ribosomal protein L4 [Patescibacteria group bacterium]
MAKVNAYSAKGIKKQDINLPKDFIEKENPTLLAQAIRVYEARNHFGLSKVKTRGEVDASTRKIYRQKGTGRARHGALSAPIFVGGGKAHGPKGVKRELSFPKKMRQKALKVALGLKAKNDDLVVVDSLSSLKKTKEAQALVNKVLKSNKKEGKVTFILSEKSLPAVRVIRNLKDVNVVPFKNLNTYQVFYGGLLLLDKEVFAKKETKK